MFSKVLRWSPKHLSQFDNIIFDCDGVLWHDAKVIDGVPEMIKELQRLGKNIVLCSNNAAKPRDKYVNIFKSHDVTIPLDSVYTSAYTAASFIHNLPLSQFDRAKHKVLVSGTYVLNDELASRGIESVNIHDLLKQVVELADADSSSPIQGIISHVLDPNIRAVVSGLDQRLSYFTLSLLTRYLTETIKNQTLISSNSIDTTYEEIERLFIATNIDSTYPVTSTIFLPGAGSMAAMLSTASNRTPLVMGKPEHHMLDAIITDKKFDRSKTLMVGDRCDTDVAFASNGGLHSLLVLTGVMSLSKLHKTIQDQMLVLNISGDSVLNNMIEATMTQTQNSNTNLLLSIDDSLDHEVTKYSRTSEINIKDNILQFPKLPTFIAPTSAWLTFDRDDKQTHHEAQLHQDIKTFQSKSFINEIK